ncbi:GNAT family N-acetyltransferase [Cellulosilyticum ruminicola]|uniref:GNAT family N-acetyltransferase n=1 Tax=Cellulosilyticum ruminicola TaxID=425254 RepID=UPI0006D05F41|nr:GNAT family N-acetyltransferase [Cellulosilyticum ruminicola]
MSLVREATIDDINEVQELWRRLLVDQMSQDIYYHGDMKFERDRKELEEKLTSEWSKIFLYIEDGKPVGFMEVEKHYPDFNFFHDYYAYVLHYYVDEAYRKAAGSVQMYIEVVKWAKEKECKYLEADAFEYNKKARTILEGIVKMKPYRTRFVRCLEKTV